MIRAKIVTIAILCQQDSKRKASSRPLAAFTGSGGPVSDEEFRFLRITAVKLLRAYGGCLGAKCR
jgi:hypothetical protein